MRSAGAALVPRLAVACALALVPASGVAGCGEEDVPTPAPSSPTAPGAGGPLAWALRGVSGRARPRPGDLSGGRAGDAPDPRAAGRDARGALRRGPPRARPGALGELGRRRHDLELSDPPRGQVPGRDPAHGRRRPGQRQPLADHVRRAGADARPVRGRRPPARPGAVLPRRARPLVRGPALAASDRASSRPRRSRTPVARGPSCAARRAPGPGRSSCARATPARCSSPAT